MFYGCKGQNGDGNTGFGYHGSGKPISKLHYFWPSFFTSQITFAIHEDIMEDFALNVPNPMRVYNYYIPVLQGNIEVKNLWSIPQDPFGYNVQQYIK